MGIGRGNWHPPAEPVQNLRVWWRPPKFFCGDVLHTRNSRKRAQKPRDREGREVRLGANEGAALCRGRAA